MFNSVLFISPLLRRFGWYARHAASTLDRRFILGLLTIVFVMVAVATTLLFVFEPAKATTLETIASHFNWALLTVIGRSPAGYVTSIGGWSVYWIMTFFGVTIVATITATVVAAVIGFLLKEGQGMGVSGLRDHVIVCGWNATARDLVSELRKDDKRVQVVLIHDADRNPAGEGVYYIKGDPTEVKDLKRAGIDEAASALVFPLDRSPEADMRSILAALTIRELAPNVRVVAEVNEPKNADHFRRAGADELMVTSHIASRLLARAAIYPGLADIVADLVSSGGSELYRVDIPSDMVGLSFEEAAYRMQFQHQATLLAVRRGTEVIFGGPRDFQTRADDDIVVIAESLGRLREHSRTDREVAVRRPGSVMLPVNQRVVVATTTALVAGQTASELSTASGSGSIDSTPVQQEQPPAPVESMPLPAAVPDPTSTVELGLASPMADASAKAASRAN